MTRTRSQPPGPLAPVTTLLASGRVEPAPELADLFRSNYEWLVGTARLLLDEPGQAEEVVQEAFIRLHSSWRRLRQPERAPAYLRSTVLNLARGRLRRRRVAQRYARPDDRPAGTPEDVAVAGDRHRRVMTAIHSLPTRQRECVVLRYYLDLSEKETASALGISSGSVKTHLHRAMATLAQRLEADE